MNPQENPLANQPENVMKKHIGNELKVMEPGETVICEIRRHPIGIVGIYAMMFFILAIIAVLAFGVGPRLAENSGNSSQVTAIGAVIFLFFAIICVIYAAISHKIYWANRWIVTSDSVTQIAQSGLFNRQSSQLALNNIEDVTVEQNGVFSQMFKYGVLKAETAGKRAKFVFLFCPNPNYYATTILEARERFEMELRGTIPDDARQPANPPQANY